MIQPEHSVSKFAFLFSFFFLMQQTDNHHSGNKCLNEQLNTKNIELQDTHATIPILLRNVFLLKINGCDNASNYMADFMTLFYYHLNSL